MSIVFTRSAEFGSTNFGGFSRRVCEVVPNPHHESMNVRRSRLSIESIRAIAT